MSSSPQHEKTHDTQRGFFRVFWRIGTLPCRLLWLLWQWFRGARKPEHRRDERTLKLLLTTVPEARWPEALDALAREERIGASERSNPGVGYGIMPHDPRNQPGGRL